MWFVAVCLRCHREVFMRLLPYACVLLVHGDECSLFYMYIAMCLYGLLPYANSSGSVLRVCCRVFMGLLRCLLA